MNDRELLPTREQIDAIDDLEALYDLRDECERKAALIEVDLDHRPGDEEWAHRARGALAAHNICFGQLGRRIYRLEKAARPPRATGKSPETIQAKANKAEAVAQRLAAEAEAKRARAEADRLALKQGILAAVDRGNYLAFFHVAASRMLDDGMLERIEHAAQARYIKGVRREVEGA